jgi:hypothetical protein
MDFVGGIALFLRKTACFASRRISSPLTIAFSVQNRVEISIPIGPHVEIKWFEAADLRFKEFWQSYLL